MSADVQQTHVLLIRHDGSGFIADPRGDNHLDKLAVDNRLGGFGVQRGVEGDNAAKRAGRVGGKGFVVSG